MSSSKVDKLFQSLREFLEGNPQVPDDYAGELRVMLAQGGATQVWTNAQVFKRKEQALKSAS